MFDLLVIGYLFLGGTGAGALTLLSVFEFVLLRVPRHHDIPRDVVAKGWIGCAACLAFGIAFLMADLGRTDRLLELLTTARLTAITVGAYSLVVSLAIASFFAIVTSFDNMPMLRRTKSALSVLGLVAGVVTATYTGVLLQGLSSVLFWQTMLLPLLFLLSSLSGGASVLMCASSFSETRRPSDQFGAVISRIDRLLLVLEALVLAAFVLWGLFCSGGQLSAWSLIAGGLAPHFWLFVVGVGLLSPFAMELYLHRSDQRSQLVWIALAVLIGCFALRYCVVHAGSFDITQMASLTYGLSLT